MLIRRDRILSTRQYRRILSISRIKMAINMKLHSRRRRRILRHTHKITNRRFRHTQSQRSRARNRHRTTLRIRLQNMNSNLLRNQRHNTTALQNTMSARLINVRQRQPSPIVQHRCHARQIRSITALRQTSRMQTQTKYARPQRVTDSGNPTPLSRKRSLRPRIHRPKDLLNRKNLTRPTNTTSPNHSINMPSR